MEHNNHPAERDSAEGRKAAYSPEEAGALLSLPPTWLRKKAAARAIPHTKIGRYLRFSEADLAEIVRLSSQPVLTNRRAA